MKTVFEFNDPAHEKNWNVINDGVMGGRSKSSMEIKKDSTALFAGVVSLENNGGFASTRTLSENFNLGDYTGLRIRILGDGKTYQLRLRTDNGFDGVAFKQEFKTDSGIWQEIDFPFDRFKATFRGRELPEIGRPDPYKIRQIGFLISQKQKGAFALKIDWIKAY